MKRLLEFVKNFDAIGRKPTLRIEDKKRYTTYLGGFLSITIYIFVIVSLLYFGQELYLKRYPSLSHTKAFVEESDKSIYGGNNGDVNINDGMVWIVFFFKNSQGNYIKSDINPKFKTFTNERKNLIMSKKQHSNNTFIKCNEVLGLEDELKHSVFYQKYIELLPYSYCINNLAVNSILNQTYSFDKAISVD